MKLNFLWKDHEFYFIEYNDVKIGELYKNDLDFWEFIPEESTADDLYSFLFDFFAFEGWELLREARRDIRKVLKVWEEKHELLSIHV